MSLTFFSRGAKRHSGMTSTHGRTPMYGSQTPMYGTGSRTPMYGSQTPLHDGESQPAADCYLSMIMKLTSCFFGLFARDIELFFSNLKLVWVKVPALMCQMVLGYNRLWKTYNQFRKCSSRSGVTDLFKTKSYVKGTYVQPMAKIMESLRMFIQLFNFVQFPQN